MDNTAPGRQWVSCPGCSEAFDPDSESPPKADDGSLQCPFCNTRFVPGPPIGAPDAIPSPHTPDASHDAGEFVVDDDDEAAATDKPAVEHSSHRRGRDLSTLKVRELAKERRALYRIRSWCLIAAIAFTVVAIQLAIWMVIHLRNEGWWWKPGAYAASIPFLLFWAVHFLRRAAALTREIRKPTLTDPTTPPDFSALSDGSQAWKNLEEL